MGENLFEEEFTIEALSQMGNPLEKLSSLVDFEMFRPALEDVLVKKDCKTPAGRPQIDVVLMFKVIFLQRYYGLGDHQIQYQITDRTSFRQFLGIHTVMRFLTRRRYGHARTSSLRMEPSTTCLMSSELSWTTRAFRSMKAR